MNEDLEKEMTNQETKRKHIKKARQEFGVEVGEDNTKYGKWEIVEND